MKYSETIEQIYSPLTHGNNPLTIPKEWKYLKVETKLVRPRGWSEDKEIKISMPHDIPVFLTKLFGKSGELDRESFFAILMNQRHSIIGIHEVTIGSATETMAPPKELFRAAILSNANVIMLVHNHPSGNLSFSDADKSVLRRLKEVAKLLEVRILDFVAVGVGGQYVSAQELGLL
jgi:DNA repair protein RadC